MYTIVPLSRVLLGKFHISSQPSKEVLKEEDETLTVMDVLSAKNPGIKSYLFATKYLESDLLSWCSCLTSMPSGGGGTGPH